MTSLLPHSNYLDPKGLAAPTSPTMKQWSVTTQSHTWFKGDLLCNNYGYQLGLNEFAIPLTTKTTHELIQPTSLNIYVSAESSWNLVWFIRLIFACDLGLWTVEPSWDVSQTHHPDAFWVPVLDFKPCHVPWLKYGCPIKNCDHIRPTCNIL